MALDIKELSDFEIKQTDIDLIKSVYNDNIIRCIIAPYHCSANFKVPDLHPTMEYIIFPEASLSYEERRVLVRNLIAHNSGKEYILVTSDMNVIVDLISPACRLLQSDGDLTKITTRLLQANIHDIRYDILETELSHENSKTRSFSISLVNSIIDMVNSGKTFSDAESLLLDEKIDLIGEVLIRQQLSDMKNNR